MDDFNIKITVYKSFNELKNCQEIPRTKLSKNKLEKNSSKIIRSHLNEIKNLLNKKQLNDFKKFCSEKNLNVTEKHLANIETNKEEKIEESLMPQYLTAFNLNSNQRAILTPVFLVPTIPITNDFLILNGILNNK